MLASRWGRSIDVSRMAARPPLDHGLPAPGGTYSGWDAMAKNRNTFEKTQRENAKRRKAEEKRAARRRKKDEPDTSHTAQPAANDEEEPAAE
jgi:hypothetical protein